MNCGAFSIQLNSLKVARGITKDATQLDLKHLGGPVSLIGQRTKLQAYTFQILIDINMKFKLQERRITTRKSRLDTLTGWYNGSRHERDSPTPRRHSNERTDSFSNGEMA